MSLKYKAALEKIIVIYSDPEVPHRDKARRMAKVAYDAIPAGRDS